MILDPASYCCCQSATRSVWKVSGKTNMKARLSERRGGELWRGINLFSETNFFLMVNP